MSSSYPRDPLYLLADEVRVENPDYVHPMDLAMEVIDRAVFGGLLEESEIDLAAGQLISYFERSVGGPVR